MASTYRRARPKRSQRTRGCLPYNVRRMLVLSFDTTSEHGGVALYRDLECLASLASQGGANYSVALFQMAGRLFAQARVSPRDVELFAVANGPGSFTGIRTGLAAAQGWASAFRRPAIGISVLAAMVEDAQPETDCAVSILDARREEFYCQLYRRDFESGESRRALFKADGQGLVLKSKDLGEYQESIECRAITCVAREHDGAAKTLRNSLPKTLVWRCVRGDLLGAIARLALEASYRGELQSPGGLDACYFRRSDAELNWRASSPEARGLIELK